MKPWRYMVRIGISMVVIVTMIFEIIPWAPVSVVYAADIESTSQEPAASTSLLQRDTFSSLENQVIALPVIESARQLVMAQAIHPEPTPIPGKTVLPPGTVAVSTAQHHVYLPLVSSSSLSLDEAVERTDLRTQSTKIFQRSDGGGYVLSYATPVHYQTADDVWQEIDNTLIEDPKDPTVYRNAANEFSIRIGGNSVDTQEAGIKQNQPFDALRVEDSEIEFSFQPLYITHTTGQISGPVMTYQNVQPAIDLAYAARSEGIELSYILKSSFSAKNSLELDVDVGDGQLTLIGNDLVLSKQGTTLWRFLLVVLVGEEKTPGSSIWKLENLGHGQYQLNLSIENLVETDSQFPIILSIMGDKATTFFTLNDSVIRDPVLGDAYGESIYPDTATGNQFNLYLGYDNLYGKGRTRIFAGFDNPNLPAGSSITDARAYFYQYVAQAGSAYPARACRVTQQWDQATLTWNNQPPVADCLGYVSVGTDLGWKSWSVPSYAQAWQNGSLTNYGIRLDTQNEYAAGGIYYSSNCWSQCSNGAYQPYMVIDYLVAPDPKLNTGLTLNPATQSINQNVNAAFNVHNYGSQSVNLSLRVTTNGGGDFTTTSCNLAAGGDCSYNQTRSFATPGTHNTCAQMNTGSGWQNIPATGSGVTCRTLSIVAPDPKINSGLTLNPTSQQAGANVAASFNVHNYGGASISNLQLRVTTNGGGDFATATCNLAAGGDCAYSKSRSFSTVGSYNTCAQMNDGSGWQNIPANGGVTCRTLSIVLPADVRLKNNLTLTPNEFDHNGGTSRAQFAVQNYGGVATTERFRARVTSGSVTFDTTSDVTLNPGASYSYDNSKNFSMVGLYEVIAEHRIGSNWSALIGNGADFIRVKAPPPPPVETEKGEPPTSGYAGEPVNTATGNYYYDATDMSAPTPGVRLDVNRWYNALDAGDVLGPFGYGSAWAYDMSITWRADKSALVSMPDGHTGYFVGDVNPDDPTDLTGSYYGQSRDTGSGLVLAADGSATLTFPNQVAYHFDTSGRIVRVSHPHPAEITVVYSNTQPVQLVHSAGVTYTLTYSDSLITGIASSSGHAVTYTYTISDDLATATRPDGSVYTYFYDAQHRLIEARTPNENAYVRNEYDGQGRVTYQYDQSGQLSTFTYSTTITAPRIYTDALGAVTTHTYDDNYRLIKEEDALGYVTLYTRDAAGNVIEKHDQVGEVWSYTYDERGNQLTETDPLGNVWIYTYDAQNNMTSQTNPLGETWTYVYDANGHLERTTDPLGYTHTYAYDSQGNLIWEQDKTGAETEYAYNDLGLQTVITDALGNVTRMAYDDLGNKTLYIDAKGNVTSFVYDDQSRLISTVDPMGTIITFTYDAMGNLLTESDGTGHFKHYVYDEYDRVTTETDFNGNTTQYGYDALGHRTVVTDALGYTTVYTYDVVGNLTARKDKGGVVTYYEYDPRGFQTREIDPLGRVTEYVYDAAGRQIEIPRPCDACTDGVAVLHTDYNAAGQVIQETDAREAITQYTYDALGRVAVTHDMYGNARTSSYDPEGHVIQETDPLGAITRYDYDVLGQLITTTNALGYQVVNMYDAVGQRIQVVNERGYTTTTTYDANGRVVSTTNALGEISWTIYDAVGNVAATTDTLNRTTIYMYDANGNRTSTTDPLSRTSQIEYDALNRAIYDRDPLGNVSSRTYDAAGRVTSMTNALGYTSLITYDIAGRKVAECSPLGYTTVYTYDNADNLIARQEPNGAIWRFTYDANGNQIQRIDPLDNVYQTEYDLLNRVTREIDPLGATVTREYDAAGNLLTETDARGATIHFVYDKLGRTTEQTNPLGYMRVYTYDAAGNLIAEQDERGFITAYTYDALDRQIAQTDALGYMRTTRYDAGGQVKAKVDYNGNVWRYMYDAAGNQIQTMDPLSNTVLTEYDALNRPVAITDALTRTQMRVYDALGQVVSETTSAGNVTMYTYDAGGRRIASTDALSSVWSTEYNAAGQPVRETDPLDRVTETAYDLLGRAVAHTDPLGRVTHYVYDAHNRLMAVTGADGTAQHYTYDAGGNILTEQDGNGHITRYEYDRAGYLIRKTDPLGRRWRYRYDASGNQIEILLPSGQTIVQAYDALGRLVRKSYDEAQIVTYTYDPNGNRSVMSDTLGVTTYAYDARNLLIASTDSAGRMVLYAYDAAGQRTTLTYPDGAVATYAYDAEGALQQVTAPDGGVTTYERDALGRVMRVQQANGVTVETVYDLVGNGLSITQRDADGAVFAQHTYTMDVADRRIEKIERLPQGTITSLYTYDALDRLVSSTSSDGRETAYAFDAAGNRTAQWGLRSRAGITETYRVDYTYNAANQLLRAVDSATGETFYSYDADGNRIGERAFVRWVTYSYDAEGHLTNAQVEVWDGAEWTYQGNIHERYGYDGDGRRSRKETISANLGSVIQRREYRYDDVTVWDVLQTYNIAADMTESRYLYDQSLHKLAYWQDGEMGYFQNDGLGSVLGATDDGGVLSTVENLMRYGDYGEDLVEAPDLPTDDGFTGYERDAYTGLNYARHRYYDAATGTFLTSDPFPTDRQDMLDLHRYLYVQANPVNMTDPLGLFNWQTGQIEWRDTLSAIARDAGTTVNAIMGVNPQIVDANRIYAGDYLRLPECRTAVCQQLMAIQGNNASTTSSSSCGYKPQPLIPISIVDDGVVIPKLIVGSWTGLLQPGETSSVVAPINPPTPLGYEGSFNFYYSPSAATTIRYYADYIHTIAKDFNVDENILASVIYFEQAYNIKTYHPILGDLREENQFDEFWAKFPAFKGIEIGGVQLGNDPSLGLGQVKLTTAKRLEKSGYIRPAMDQRQRAKRLLDPYFNIRYVAAELAYQRNRWGNYLSNVKINDKQYAGVWATTYNLGNGSTPHDNPHYCELIPGEEDFERKVICNEMGLFTAYNHNTFIEYLLGP